MQEKEKIEKSDHSKMFLPLDETKKYPIRLEYYETQVKSWPVDGKHILAQYDDDTIIVYQAFRKEIAEFAIKNNYFGGDHYSTTRMTWIKTNFCWMQYRSGWSQKPGQEYTLAIRLKRSCFDRLLKNAVHSHYVENLHGSKEDWEKSLKKQEGVIRLQWDPDHSPVGGKLQRRAIQLGIKDGDIIEIQDVSQFCIEQYSKNVDGWNDKFDNLITPIESVYQVDDKEIAKSLTLIIE